jgi:hypothetical protein
LHEAISAQVNKLLDPEAVSEIRHLDYHRRNIETYRTRAIDDILIGQATKRSSGSI